MKEEWPPRKQNMPEVRVHAMPDTPWFKLFDRKDKTCVLATGKKKEIEFIVQEQRGFVPEFVVFASNVNIVKVEQEGTLLMITALKPGKVSLRVLLDDASGLFHLITGDPEEDNPIEIEVEVF